MTNYSTSNKSTKRGRGRPKGSSKLKADDTRILKKVAHMRLNEPNAKLATLVKQLGDVTDNDIRRLRNKWKANKQRYLDEALIERNEAENRGWLGEILHGVQVISEWANKALTTLPIENIGRYIADAQDKADAIERLGLSPEPPFNVVDRDQLASAIARFEMREHRSVDDLGASFPEGATLLELPKSQKLYAHALMLYGLYEEARGKELTDEQTRQVKGPQQQNNKGSSQ